MCHGARTGQRVGARHARPARRRGRPVRGCAPAALSRGAVAPPCAPWLSGGVGARSAPTSRRARSPRGVEQGAAFWCARLKNVRVRLAARLLHGHIDLPRAVHIRLLTLLWHFEGVLRNSAVAVGTSARNRWRSEQLGDDGTADFRQWRRPVGGQLFSPDPQPSGAGVADRQTRCRSSAHTDADRSRTDPRSRQGRVPA